MLPLVVGGLSNDEIGSRLGVSVATANFHVRSLLRKFDVATRVELAVKAVARGHVRLMARDGAKEGSQRWVCAAALDDDHAAEPPRSIRFAK